MTSFCTRQLEVFILFCVLSSGLLLSFSSGSAPALESFADPNEMLIQKLASDFAKPCDDASFEHVGLIHDDYWEQILWSVRWITPEHRAIEVQLDADTHEIVFYLDTTKLADEYGARRLALSDEAVWRKAMEFVDRLERFESMPIPKDAEFAGITENSQGWQLTWNHVKGSVPVREDFIRIGISRDTALVYAFAKCWHTIDIECVPVISSSKAVEIASRALTSSDDFDLTCELSIIGHVLDEKIEYDPHLAWLVSNAHQRSSHVKLYIDAMTAEIISQDTTLDINEDVFVYDPGYELTYECATDIFHRLNYATEGDARYFEDPTTSEVLSKLNSERVFYYLGHGDYEMVEGDWYTYLITYDGEIWPSDVENKDLSGMDLAYLSACWSAADNFWNGDWWQDIDKNMTQAFLDGGAKCVFGWDEDVYKGQSMKFSRYFFDYAVNALSFSDCYWNAYYRVPPGTQDIAVIYGDTTLSLDEDDYGSDAWPGTNLGSGYDTSYHVYDEGLWDPDIDWYRFTITGYHSVSIFVMPNKDDMDIAFYVNDEYMYAVLTRDRFGPGHQESGAFMGNGQTYFLCIYKTDSHGGHYDLIVFIGS